ncbi:hypothetical protein F1880_003065 [Penicillium rolfsii]|nr:hypothetical protein F1880_003065 [Penicillium rolfsii]
MCRSVARLLRAPPIQHAANSGLGSRCHPSSRIFPDRSMPTVVRSNPPALLLARVRHAARPVLHIHHPLICLNGLAGPAQFSTHPCKLVASSPRTLTQNLVRDIDDYLDGATEVMAVDPNVADVKPADILNGDVPPSAERVEAALDPESDEDVPVDPEELQEALTRPPPVNSSYLPLPWKGRLGYACLNTYLRYSNPPVFCSRTCRIASILENRHPLQDPDQPPHATKNRPDREQPADVARGQAFVEALGLANAHDLVKLLRWNDKYGIKFMRISSEMFPFASHKEYGYKLAPFASEVLADAGRVVAELGHRVSVHPGQFTQLGSPRREVVESSYRDLEYHSEMLQLLKLPPQQDRDAVMILHMGGVFGDKAATLDRFRENYAVVSQDIKNRLVLENDDVSWTVHDLLPICEELNIPLVLDYHHHNILFDANEVREGTQDIIPLYDRIAATWSRKNITQKMHYSEQTPAAITPRQRRKHSDRVATLPPCNPTMDLMIEAKDKEQAVFELMRNFKLPGYELINDLIPYTRTDENKPFKPPRKSKKNGGFVDLEGSVPPPRTIPEDKVGMGGPDGRVYWPRGMEEWLRPAKKVVKPKAAASPAKRPNTKKVKSEPATPNSELETPVKKTPKTPPRRTPSSTKSRSKRKAEQIESTPESEDLSSLSVDNEDIVTASQTLTRRSGRAKKSSRIEASPTGNTSIPREILAPKPYFRWPVARSRLFTFRRPPTASSLQSKWNLLAQAKPRPSRLSSFLRFLVGPQATRRAQNRLWDIRHEALPALRHRAQSRIYRAIVKRQARLAARNRRFGGGFVASLLGSRRQLLRGARTGTATSSSPFVRRARATQGGTPDGAKDAVTGSMASTWGTGTGDGATQSSRRKKAYEWIKAANEVGQAYASRWTSQRGEPSEDYYNTPGAFPDVEIARSGDEEMVLFPSYARRLDVRKMNETAAQRRRDSWSETIDEYRGISKESNPTGNNWEDPNLENAVVDVDVRGWIYAPSRGPMSRKHRLMIKLARTLSGIPAPSGATADDSSDRIPNKGEDELVDKQMQNLVDTAEKDADQAWKSSNSDRTRPGTGTGNAVGQAVAMTKDEISMANAHLMERLRPFLTNPMAGMPVTVFFFNDDQSESRNLLTDESGHFNLRAAMPFVPTHIRVLASEDLSAAKPIDIIEPVGISLISDIDDTVKHSAIASGAKEMFRNTFVRELAELTVDGVSEWYTQLAKKGVEIHYVSNAPWQLYPLLERYFKQVGLPPGSFHLKQYSGMLQGIFEPTAERKRGSLEQIMRDFPERKFILVGDSGEADLEVYTDIVQANPGRILGIFIRDVTTPDKKPFFDQSVGHLESEPEPVRRRSTPQLIDHSDSFVNRPTLPPRRPLAPPPGVDLERSNSEDLIDLRDEETKEKDAAPKIPTTTKPRLPPGKPTKPSSLRTASGVGDIPGSVTTNEKPFSQETIRRKPAPPLPPRRFAAKSDSLIDLDTSPPLSRSRTEPSTGEGNPTGLPSRSKAPPPVPPPRRSNTASSTTGSGSSEASTPRSAAPAPKQSYPAAAGAAAQAAFNYAAERLNFSASPVQNLRTSTNSYNSYSAAEPLPNKREELWRRRWERASDILEKNGVVLGSWRTGSDAQPVCLWLVDEAMKKIQVNGSKAGAGRRS